MSASATSAPDLRISVGAASERGRRRAVNEDSCLAAHPVYLVADGMGGHDAGDRASAAAVAAFAPLVGRDDVAPDEVVRAVRGAHLAVAAIAERTRRGAGTTLSGVVAVDHGDARRWLVLNIGDSRVYRLLSNRLEQLTVDHSIVQSLADEGRLDRAELARHGGRHVITRAVGDERSDADYWLVPIVTGERLLVCSDGLAGALPHEALHAGLALGGATAPTARTLVGQAAERGSRDDVTAVVVDVLAGGVSPRADDVTGGASPGTSFSHAMIDLDTVPGTRRRRG